MRSFMILMFAIIALVPVVTASWDRNRFQRTEAKQVYKKSRDDKKFLDSFLSSQDNGLDWGSEEMLQHPIDEPVKKRINRGNGELCSFGSDCRSGCCQIDRVTNLRVCRPKAKTDENCALFPIKGNVYDGGCPCESYEDFCSSSQKVCIRKTRY